MQKQFLGRQNLMLWAAAVVFGFAGLLLNFAKYELFFNVDLLFGGAAVILGVKFLHKKAILSALIASLATYFIWNHPYAIIIFTLEIVFITLADNDRYDIILKDLTYWIIIGIPLVLLFYHVVMHMPLHTSLMVALKQAVNGILNTIIASFIFQIINITNRYKGRPYRPLQIQTLFFKIFVAATILPCLLFICLSVREGLNQSLHNISKQLSVYVNTAIMDTSAQISDNMGKEMFIADELRGRDLKSPETKALLDNMLGQILKTSDNFIGMGVIDKNFTAVSLFTKDDDGLTDRSGINFSDRDYYSDARNANGLYISDVYVNKINKNRLNMVVVLHPLKDASGKLIGYIQGGINFSTLKKRMESLTSQTGVQLTLTDRHGSAIFSTGKKFDSADDPVKALQYGELTSVGNDTYLWQPKAAPNISFMSRWLSSYYIKTGILSGSTPFQIIAKYPLADYVTLANNKGFRSLASIFIIILCSTLLAWFLSETTSRHLRELSLFTKNLPEKTYKGEDIHWTGSMVIEVQELTDNFIEMQKQLTKRFYQLKQASQENRLILDSIPMIIFVKGTRNNILTGNRAASLFLGLPQEKLAGADVSDIFVDDHASYYNDDLTVIKTASPLNGIIQEYKGVNGVRNMQTDKIPILGKNGEVESILVISKDITDELKASDERHRTLQALYQQSKMAEMGAMIASITHQWKQPLNNIAMIAQVIQSDAEDGSTDNESLIENSKMLMTNINFMSQTVEDFTNFFKQNKEKQLFRPCETVKDIYGLLEKQFIKNNIQVVFHDHKHFELNSYKNEFKQVCLNILNNAKDALVEHNGKDKRIDVLYEKTDKFGIIHIRDNGGGIDESLLPDKLFEPYHSTKGDKGTGIGLYICKTIVENNIGGTLTAANVGDGAEFTITLPL